MQPVHGQSGAGAAGGHGDVHLHPQPSSAVQLKNFRRPKWRLRRSSAARSTCCRKDLLNVNARSLLGSAFRSRHPDSPSSSGKTAANPATPGNTLKQACRARSKSEPILPDAQLPRNKTGPAQADFQGLVMGPACDLNWTQGKEPPEALRDRDL